MNSAASIGAIWPPLAASHEALRVRATPSAVNAGPTPDLSPALELAGYLIEACADAVERVAAEDQAPRRLVRVERRQDRPRRLRRMARLQAAAAAGLHESPQRQAMRRSRPAAGLGKNVSNDQGDALPSKLAIDSNQTATIAVMTADVTSASMCRVRL